MGIVLLLPGCAAGPVPAPLAAIADQRAAGLSADPAVRRRYLDHFAVGARDALIWRAGIEPARLESARACAGSSDLQLRTVECGYADGILAVFGGNAALTLEDFGYQKASAEARLRVSTGSPVRYIEVSRGKPWLIASSPAADDLIAEQCYRLEGFLGRSGALDSRYAQYSREFVVMTASPGDSCDAAGNR